MKLAYTLSRLLFGGWFLYFGLEYFLPWDLQPLGNSPLAREFTLALIHSGLFAWIKALEFLVGVLMLANRAVFPAALAIAPVTVVICYWNFVLDPGVIEYTAGILCALCNAIMIWPNRDRLTPMLIWRSDRP